MGDPKKKHKTYTTPKRPYYTDTLLDELRLIGMYGLRNKRELWKARTELSTIRRRARELLSLSSEERSGRQSAMTTKLFRRGLVRENASLEEVLTLTIEDLLERRLQTMVWRRDLAHSLFQARQMITHGHVSIYGQKIRAPSYHVHIEDESTLDYSRNSPFANPDHPFRKEMAIETAIGGEEENE
jgi:small subunit ribosomal protein S4